MVYKVGLFIFFCLFVACSSAERKDRDTAGELIRQAAFYGERLQYLPALDIYRQAAELAKKEKDSLALLQAYQGLGRIYRYQSFKQKALDCDRKALSYIGNTTGDSLQTALYREIGDVFNLSGMADSALHYYWLAGCRVEQAKLLQQQGRLMESEALLKAELEQQTSGEKHAELRLALANLQIARGALNEAEKNLSHVPSSQPQLYAALAQLATSRGDSLQADFYHKSYLHNLTASRQQTEDNQITQLLWTSEQKEWEKRLSSAQSTQRGQVYAWSGLLLIGGVGIWGYMRYRKKDGARALSEAEFHSSEVYLRFHRKEEWRPASKDWEELLQAINRTYPEFRCRLKKKIPKLSEQEWQMCCLIKMDVPPSVMAMLLCCTNQAISMRRVRLYLKITGEKAPPELCDAFIRDF